MTARFITHEQARRFYDRIGRGQDARPLSERRALDALAAQGDFGSAAAVLELGCGTGRFAARLLREGLPGDATYLGLDVSPHMVRLARAALARWPGRARIELTDGSVRLPVPDASVDRVVSTYVLDLLSPADAAAFMTEARRVLRPGGLLAAGEPRTGPHAAGAPHHPPVAGALAPEPGPPRRLPPAPARRPARPRRVDRPRQLPGHRLVPQLRRPGRAPPLSACRLAHRRGGRADGRRRVPHTRPRADRLDRGVPRAHRGLPRHEPGAAGRGGGAAARRATAAGRRPRRHRRRPRPRRHAGHHALEPPRLLCTTSPATATSRPCSPTSSRPGSACRA